MEKPTLVEIKKALADHVDAVRVLFPDATESVRVSRPGRRWEVRKDGRFFGAVAGRPIASFSLSNVVAIEEA